MGIREGDDLAGVARVGYDLLVTAEHSVEHKLSTRYAGWRRCPDGYTFEHLPVGEHQKSAGALALGAAPSPGTARAPTGRSLHLCASLWTTTDFPSHIVRRRRSVSVRAVQGVLRLQAAIRTGRATQLSVAVDGA